MGLLRRTDCFRPKVPGGGGSCGCRLWECPAVQPRGTAVGHSGNNRGGAALRVRNGAPPHVSEPRRALGSLPVHLYRAASEALSQPSSISPPSFRIGSILSATTNPSLTSVVCPQSVSTVSNDCEFLECGEAPGIRDWTGLSPTSHIGLYLNKFLHDPHYFANVITVYLCH